MARVCLNMIVKNESAIIERCLAAAAPHIDAYCICDTGSTDQTPAMIERVFANRGVPGRVVRTTFLNFEQARNEALDAALASGLDFDYILLCDADMELRVDNPGYRDTLRAPAYMVLQRTATNSLAYENLRLVRKDVPARYRGVTHEYLDVGPVERPTLTGVWYLDHASGSNRAVKYQRDIALLLDGLKAEPNNARYVFYLANSYYDLGDAATALGWYEKRAGMGGWAEEAFYAKYRAALCLGTLKRPAEMIARLVSTFDAHPHRAEPLHTLALHFQRAGEHRAAYLFAEAGSKLPEPSGALFVEPEVYAWRLLDIMSVSLYYMGRPADGLALAKRVLELAPEMERPRIFQNVQFCERASPR